MKRWHPSARRWRHSIRHRLVGLFLLLALAIGGVFLAGTQRLLKGGWQEYARPLVADYLDRVARDLGSPPDVARAQQLVARLPVELAIEGPSVRWQSAGFSAPGWRRHDAHDHDARDWGTSRQSADGHRIVFTLREPPPEWRPRAFGWATLAALLLCTALAFAVVRRMLAPLDDIGRAVEAYGRGELATPLAVQGDDELGDLSRRIRHMAGELQGMLDAKRALLLAISHELRSPLTRARVNAELIDDGPAREALLRDLSEMAALITSLLESERLAQGHAALHAEDVDLAALAREMQAAAGDISVRIESAVIPVRADPMRLRLLLRNLLDNARRHAPGTAIELLLRREPDGRLALGVRDHGPGLPATELAQLGQAFYRPDAARAREQGGVGLGLHLCRLVAQAHGGELRLRNATPGLEVTMVWTPA
jgi:signal transduction histidine kinase